MNQIQQMFKLQQQLNNNTNGVEWVSGVTENNRKICWYRCIYMEVCEAINSLNWKHWKDINKKPNWNNVKVELVDIWHFIMSEAIRVNDADYANKYIDTKPSVANENVLINTLEKMLFISIEASLDESQDSIRKIIDLFFEALSNSEVSIVELYKYYIIKNQLNTFRQKHGYKDGTYVKIWDAVEDNVVAFNIMEDNPDLTPEQLYKKFEEEYQIATS